MFWKVQMLYFCIFCEFSWLYLYNFVKNWIICEHESIFCDFLIILCIFIIIRPKMVPKMIPWASCICLETILDESGAQYLYFLWNSWFFCEIIVFFVNFLKLQVNSQLSTTLSHIYRSGDYVWWIWIRCLIFCEIIELFVKI